MSFIPQVNAERDLQSCAASENGLELFPARLPAEQKMKLVQTVDTATCTYELALSFKPDTVSCAGLCCILWYYAKLDVVLTILSFFHVPLQSIPFIDHPSRPMPDAPSKTIFTDVPDNFHAVCDAEGYNEALTGTAQSPLSPTNHVGLNTHYTEYSYTLFTSDRVAAKTGFKDVVLGECVASTILDSLAVINPNCCVVLFSNMN